MDSSGEWERLSVGRDESRYVAQELRIGRQVAIVGTATETNLDIARAWRMLGVEAHVLSPASSLALLRPDDVALGRIDVRRSLDGVEAGLLELGELSRRGIRVLNPPAALLRSHDKLRTARALAASSVAHPRTEQITALRPVSSLRPPVVVKPRFGSWGADIVRCDTGRELRSAIDALAERSWFRRRGALVQSLVPPVGHDLRVLVAGGRIVGAESRVAAAGEWRTNISLGGTGRAAEVPARARVAALAAAKAVGGDFVGIDLLPDQDGYVVIEVNGAVDFQAYYSLSGRNVYADMAAALGLLPALAEPVGALCSLTPGAAVA